MPYDKFLMAQIAGDLMPDPDRYRAGLGFFANSPQFQEDRVDALTRGFMALTAACAQCHDHKFDPIPTRDYYSLLGVFENTKSGEYPLAPAEVVEEFKRRKNAAEDAGKAVAEFENREAAQLAEILAAKSAKYLQAARSGTSDGSLDTETLGRWKEYLADGAPASLSKRRGESRVSTMRRFRKSCSLCSSGRNRSTART